MSRIITQPWAWGNVAVEETYSDPYAAIDRASSRLERTVRVVMRGTPVRGPRGASTAPNKGDRWRVEEADMNILVAIEDDMLWEDVLATLRWCVRVSESDRVMVLHVTPRLLPWLPRSGESYARWADLIRVSSQRAEQFLAAAGCRLSTWDIEAELLQEADDPATAILRVAGERQAGLVIVGARGRKERGFLIGSVSQKVKALAVVTSTPGVCP